MSQRQINAAYTRKSKPCYRGLSSIQKRLIKLQEEYNMLERSINSTYKIGLNRFGKDFRKHLSFQHDFSLIYIWGQRREKILELIDRIEIKNNIKLLDVLHLHNELRMNYSGSY